MTSAEAISSSDDPGVAELVGLLGWPWKLALLLLAAAPALWFLPASGLLAIDSRPWAGPAALACAGSAALLSLGASLWTLHGLLAGTAAAAEAGDARAVIDSLRQMLEEQRLQMHEATAAVGRAVTTGAQLSGLARAVEKQLKDTLEQPAILSAEGGQSLLASLRQTVSWVDAELGAATARLATMAERAERGQGAPSVPAFAGAGGDLPARLESVASRLESAVPAEALSRIEHCAAQLEGAGAALAALPAATAQLGQGVGRIQQAAQALEGVEGALAALPALATRLGQSAGEMGAAARRIGQTQEAARALTEAAGTFSAGVARMEGLTQTLAPLAEVPQAMAELSSGAARLTHLAERLEVTGTALDRLPETAEQLAATSKAMAERAGSTQLQAARLARLAERGEAALSEATRRLAQAAAPEEAGTAARLQEIVQRLAEHVERMVRSEASLGDAARYLTETTDRFSDGTASLEMQAVRLQAMISIAGNRETHMAEMEPLRATLAALEQHLAAAARLGGTLDGTRQQLEAVLAAASALLTARSTMAPTASTAGRLLEVVQDSALPPAIRLTLERLGSVESSSAELLEEAEKLARQAVSGAAAMPPALAVRAPELLSAVEESIRRLNSAATALALASDGSGQQAA